jgi:hypothetical protein
VHTPDLKKKSISDGDKREFFKKIPFGSVRGGYFINLKTKICLKKKLKFLFKMLFFKGLFIRLLFLIKNKSFFYKKKK